MNKRAKEPELVHELYCAVHQLIVDCRELYQRDANRSHLPNEYFTFSALTETFDFLLKKFISPTHPSEWLQLKPRLNVTPELGIALRHLEAKIFVSRLNQWKAAIAAWYAAREAYHASLNACKPNYSSDSPKTVRPSAITLNKQKSEQEVLVKIVEEHFCELLVILAELEDKLAQGELPGQQPAHVNTCPIELGEKSKTGKSPVTVLGRDMEISSAQYDVVKTLVDVFPGKLTKDQLVEKSGRTGALGILNTLIGKRNELALVIKMAGGTGEGYEIINPTPGKATKSK